MTALHIEPQEVRNGQYPAFHVTFLNTTGTSPSYKWFVKIYEPDKRNSFGETAKSESILLVGTSEVASQSNWKAAGAAPCRPFIARVFYQAADNTILEFAKPDGNRPEHYFSVCP